MCGIVGISSKNEFSPKDAVNLLKRLEYRGYDSFGYVTKEGKMQKFVGEIDNSLNKIKDSKTKNMILHTRWSTHGIVNKMNAHPHSDCKNELFLVHNGILRNYEKLKKKLSGHTFTSDTDSEVIVHYIEEQLKNKDILQAISAFASEAEGEFAILLTRKGDDKIYAFKRGSPMVLGVGKENIVASDIYAFSNKTRKAVFFNENDLAVVSDSYEFYKLPSLKKVEREIREISWSPQEDKKDYEHFMLKEIMEQPSASQRLLDSLKNGQKEKTDELKNLIKKSKRIVFVASGSSYHASLLGVYFLNKVGIEAHTIIASEFRNFSLFDNETLVIAISQSGETMDVIEALHGIKEKGVKIASLVNVPHSTIERMSNVSVNIEAGQEICVASTKALTNQIIALLYLATLFGFKSEIEKIPGEIKKFLDKNGIESIGKSLKDEKDVYIIGRGLFYPIAREIALKLKEIAYIHAEGMMGGELKHGTLALIEKGTPVIAMMPQSDEDIVSNVKEVEARGARIISFGDDVEISSQDDATFSILAIVAGQLLTYYTAKEKGLPIDKPRNLAKCCTVK